MWQRHLAAASAGSEKKQKLNLGVRTTNDLLFDHKNLGLPLPNVNPQETRP